MHQLAWKDPIYGIGPYNSVEIVSLFVNYLLYESSVESRYETSGGSDAS